MESPGSDDDRSQQTSESEASVQEEYLEDTKNFYRWKEHRTRHWWAQASVSRPPHQVFEIRYRYVNLKYYVKIMYYLLLICKHPSNQHEINGKIKYFRPFYLLSKSKQVKASSSHVSDRQSQGNWKNGWRCWGVRGCLWQRRHASSGGVSLLSWWCQEAYPQRPVPSNCSWQDGGSWYVAEGGFRHQLQVSVNEIINLSP